MITKPTFNELIGKLSTIFNEHISEARAELYYKYLCQLMTDSDFYKIVQHIVLNNDKFPTIAAFVRADDFIKKSKP